MPKHEHRYLELLLASALLAGACATARETSGSGSAEPDTANAALSCPDPPVTLAEARPLVTKYCATCHSPSGSAGEDFDFRADGALTAHRRSIEAKLRLGAMPPPGVPHPSGAERSTLRCWAKG